MIVGLGLFWLKLYHNMTDGWTDSQTARSVAITALRKADAQ